MSTAPRKTLPALTTVALGALLFGPLQPEAQAQPRGARGVLAGEAPGATLRWRSWIRVRHIAGTSRRTTALPPGNQTYTFSARNFGARSNMMFEVEVWVPGVTDDRSKSHQQVMNGLAPLNLVVKAPGFIRDGSRPLQLHRRNTGPFGGNALLGFSLADNGNYGGTTPPSGLYPVEIVLGTKTVGRFTLNWINHGDQPPAGVGPHSLTWRGTPRLRWVSGHRSRTEPLANNRTVRFAANQFGSRSNMIVELDIFARGITDDPQHTNVAATLRDLDLRVESPWIRGGKRSVRLAARRVGPYGSNWTVAWQLADSANFGGGSTPAAGLYPVRLMAGTQEVARFVLDWRQQQGPRTRGPHSVAWHDVPVVRTTAGTTSALRPLANGEALAFRAADLGARRNLGVELDLYLPGVSDRDSTAALQAQALSEVRLRIESSFLPGGSQTLRAVGVRRGTWRNDMRAAWSLGDAANYANGHRPATGRYAFRLLLGDRELGSFTLDYEAP